MIIVPMNLLSIPIVFVIWTIDSLLFLTLIRLALRKSSAIRSTEAYKGLRHLTDPLHAIAERCVNRGHAGPPRPWLPWLLIVSSLSVGRSLLAGILLAASG